MVQALSEPSLGDIKLTKKEMSEVIMCAGTLSPQAIAKGSARSEEMVMNISTSRAYFQQDQLSEARY